MMISFFKLSMALCLSKVTIHSFSYNCLIELRLDLRLGKIFACFAWIDTFFSGIRAWCVDAIIDELGSFTLIGSSDGSLV